MNKYRNTKFKKSEKDFKKIEEETLEIIDKLIPYYKRVGSKKSDYSNLFYEFEKEYNATDEED